MRLLARLAGLTCLAALLAGAEERIVFRGSLAVKPIVDAAAAAFAAAQPGVAIASEGCTSDASLTAVLSGEAQLGALVKELTAEQRREHPDLRTIPVAIDGLVLVVHARNPLPGLNREQVAGIFTGAIASWGQLGGAANAIRPVVRTTSFATSAFFGASFALEYREDGLGAGRRMQHRMLGATVWGPARSLVTDDHSQGLALVAANPDAITYAPYGIAKAAIAAGGALRLLALDGVQPDPVSIQGGTYPATRTCLLLVRGDPQGRLLDFVSFMTSDAGQRLVESCAFVPLAK